MCLYPKHSEPKIASRDITCYKVIFKDNWSYWFDNYRWYQGKTHYSSLLMKPIEEIDLNVSVYPYKRVVIQEGLHSFSSILVASMQLNFEMTKVIKTIIPKGAKYYIGADSELASDQLIYPIKQGLKVKIVNFIRDILC